MIVTSFSSFFCAASIKSRAVYLVYDLYSKYCLLITDHMTLEAKKNPWPNDPESYELLDIIGYGATATVQAALCKPRNEKCALKRINLDKCNVTMDELLKEITVMSQCHHENVVSYYTSFVVRDELWLVIELLRGGSLLDEIKRITRTQDCKNGVLEEVLIATILKEVLKGVEYFHNNNQIHRDIKAGNILIGEDGVVQIADFGVSSWINTGGNLDRRNIRHTFVGTPCWMAPEVMEQVSGYNAKADIWSFGITAIELATGTAPYYKYPPMKVLMLTLSNDPPTLETAAEDKDQYKNYSKVFRKMIADCLQKDPEKRPTATELLKHPFFKKAKDKRYIYQMLLSDRQLPKSLPQSSAPKAKTTPSLTFGRLHRTETGEWEWSGDEDSGTEKESPSKTCPPLKGVVASGLEPADQQATISSGGGSPSPYLLSRDRGALESRDRTKLRDESEDDDDDPDVTQRTQRLVLTSSTSRDHDTPTAKSRDVRKTKESIRAQFFDEPLPTDQRLVKGDQSVGLKAGATDNHHNNNLAELILFLALRIRNSKLELNDIKFDFTPGSDTADGVAQELLGAGLIESSNIKVITENLSKLIAEPVEGKSIVFALKQGSEGGSDAVTDPKTLVGYAQLTLLTISYATPEYTKGTVENVIA